VAYESLLRDARRAHHGAAARALEANAVLAEGQPELVAYHLTEAGEDREAVIWWRRAAGRAEVHGDPAAALDHLARAHDLLAGAESGADAIARMEVDIDRANSMRVVAQLDDALEVLDAIEPLAERLERHDILARLWFTRGNILFWKDPPRCQAAHERALAEGERAGSVESQARALGGLGDGAYLRGAFTVSQDCFTRCVDLARSAGLTDIEADNAPMLCALAYMLNGGPIVAELGLRALEVTGRARRPRAHVLAHMPIAMWHNANGEPERGLELALAGLHLLEDEYRILFFRSGFRSIVAQAYLQLGRHDEAREILEQLTNPGPEDRGGEVYAPFVHTCLALIDADTARLDTALDRADLTMWSQSLDRFIPMFLEACIRLRAWDRAERALHVVDTVPPAEICGLLEAHVEGCRGLVDLARGRDPEGARARLAGARAIAERMELVTLLEAIDAAAGEQPSAAASR
jgi:tetratricopeptide (TPR) repeat protein